MSAYTCEGDGFRLIPFIQNRNDTVNFFLATRCPEKQVFTFVVGVDDFTTPELFMDMLMLAVESLAPLGGSPAYKAPA